MKQGPLPHTHSQYHKGSLSLLVIVTMSLALASATYLWNMTLRAEREYNARYLGTEARLCAVTHLGETSNTCYSNDSLKPEIKVSTQRIWLYPDSDSKSLLIKQVDIGISHARVGATKYTIEPSGKRPTPNWDSAPHLPPIDNCSWTTKPAVKWSQAPVSLHNCQLSGETLLSTSSFASGNLNSSSQLSLAIRSDRKSDGVFRVMVTGEMNVTKLALLTPGYYLLIAGGNIKIGEVSSLHYPETAQSCYLLLYSSRGKINITTDPPDADSHLSKPCQIVTMSPYRLSDSNIPKPFLDPKFWSTRITIGHRVD